MERIDDQAITVEDLSKRFGQTVAVDSVTFTVDRGTIAGFLGPNGAGKSTTLRMLLGLMEPSGGRARINGVAYRDLPNPTAEVGSLLDAGAFHPGRTGLETLRLAAVMAGVGRARVAEVLELVHLTAAESRQRVGTYSLGMRQRLGLAVALLAEPPVLVLDEPANGLDPQGVRWMRDLLRALAAKGHTILLSSHMLHEVEQIADELIVIGQGRIQATGPLHDVLGGSGSLEDAYFNLTASTQREGGNA